VTLEAYNAENKLVDTKTVKLTPNSKLKSKIKHFFVGLKPAKTVKVDVSILNLGSIGSAATAALFDNVSYTLYD
jgi:hypothetical protein